MRLALRQRRWITVLNLWAVILGTLLPVWPLALQPRADFTPWLEVCAGSGPARLSAEALSESTEDSAVPGSSEMDAHCPWCPLQHPVLALSEPVLPPLFLQALLPSSGPPASAQSSSLWQAGSPRGPPEAVSNCSLG